MAVAISEDLEQARKSPRDEAMRQHLVLGRFARGRRAKHRPAAAVSGRVSTL